MTSDFETIISNEFLKYIFSREVETFTYKIATKPGENYLSSIYRVNITFKNDEGTKSILVKCYPEKESTRKFLDGGLMFPTEYFIYDKFIPSLNKLANEISSDILRNEACINVAGFYGGNIVGRKQMSRFAKEPWINVNFLILEDLLETNFIMLEGRKGLNLEQCLLVINQLANVHALSWVYKQRNGIKRLVDKYEYFHDEQFRKGDEERWRSEFGKVNQESLSVIEAEFGPDSEIFLKLQSLLTLDVVEIFMDFLSTSGIDEIKAESLLKVKPDSPISEPNEPWLVATHADTYVNNLLFSFNNRDDHGGGGVVEQSEKPTKVVLIDHQTFREACLTTDLAYFIYSSIKPCVRKEIINVLLETYFEKFTKIISAVGGKPPVGFTYEAFQRRWRRARIFALLMFLQLVPFVYKTSSSSSVKSNNSSSSNSSVEFNKKDKDEIQLQSESIKKAPQQQQSQEQDEWKTILIQTVLQEYNDGIF